MADPPKLPPPLPGPFRSGDTPRSGTPTLVGLRRPPASLPGHRGEIRAILPLPAPPVAAAPPGFDGMPLPPAAPAPATAGGGAQGRALALGAGAVLALVLALGSATAALRWPAYGRWVSWVTHLGAPPSTGPER
jgi:hypothetical protein